MGNLKFLILIFAVSFLCFPGTQGENKVTNEKPVVFPTGIWKNNSTNEDILWKSRVHELDLFLGKLLDRVSDLEKEDVNTKKDLEELRIKVVHLTETNQELLKHIKSESTNKENPEKITKTITNVVNKDDEEKNKETTEEPNLEERVEKLENLSRVGTLRSCEEYAAFGIRSSGWYPIDPDGILVGQTPFTAYCRFDEKNDKVSTEIIHDYSESLTNVDHCHDPGCYTKNLTYISGDDKGSFIIDVN